ncbi:MAG TPA: VanZ family protein [Bacteroidales bacterium]
MFRRLWPAIVWALVVLVLTGFPGSYIPKVTGFWEWLSLDKLVHVVIFATLGFLLFYGFHEQYLKSKRRYLYVLAVLMATMAYGMITEILQRYIFIGRNGNMYDFLADSVGGVLGFLAFILYNKKKKNES